MFFKVSVEIPDIRFWRMYYEDTILNTNQLRGATKDLSVLRAMGSSYGLVRFVFDENNLHLYVMLGCLTEVRLNGEKLSPGEGRRLFVGKNELQIGELKFLVTAGTSQQQI